MKSELISQKNMKKKTFSLRSSYNSQRIVPYFFVLPFILSFLVFFLYPIISSVIMSFQSIQGFHDVIFIGPKNYKSLMNQHYFAALRVSFTYTLLTIAILIPLPLILASLLNSKLLKGKNFFRSALFLPALTSVIVAGMFFRYTFSEQSTALANQIVGIFGIKPLAWLQTGGPAMFALVILCAWRWLGVNIIYFLSGLQSIPEEHYEAADIDGANALQKFSKITIPSLRPVLIYVVTISVYGGFAMFAESFAYWSYRSPGDIGLTLVGYIYSTAFNSADFGLAAAVGVTLLLLIMTVNLLQLMLFGFFKKESD